MGGPNGGVFGVEVGSSAILCSGQQAGRVRTAAEGWSFWVDLAGENRDDKRMTWWLVGRCVAQDGWRALVSNNNRDSDCVAVHQDCWGIWLLIGV